MWAKIIAAVAGMLLGIAPDIIGRVMLYLGLTAITFTGFEITLSALKSQVVDNMSAMPVEVLSLLAWLWVDKAIGMIFSAYTAALAVRLAGSTSVSFWAMRKKL